MLNLHSGAAIFFVSYSYHSYKVEAAYKEKVQNVELKENIITNLKQKLTDDKWLNQTSRKVGESKETVLQEELSKLLNESTPFVNVPTETSIDPSIDPSGNGKLKVQL